MIKADVNTIKEIRRCEDCPKYGYTNLGHGGGFTACYAEEPLYGKPVDHILAHRTRPNWCPFKAGEHIKLEFVFVESR